MRTPKFATTMIAAVAALTLLATACGRETAAPPEGQPGPQEGPIGSTAFALDDTFWYAGFKVSLDGAAVEVDEYGSAQLVVTGTFENLGPAEQMFPGPDLYVESEGTVIPALFADVPMIPAGATTQGSLSFPVDPGFTPDEAILFAGAPALHQAIIPLGVVGSGHDCAPATVVLSEEFMAGTLRVAINGAEVRPWSFPFGSDGQQAEAGTTVLALSVDFTYEGDWENSGVFNDQVELTLPDGTVLQPENSVNQTLDKGESARGVIVEFRVPEEWAGEYTLTVTEFETSAGMGGVDDPVGAVTFTI